jgi:hypothetical protein
MPKQKRLLFDSVECLDALWEQFPEEDRRGVVTLYAQLIVKAIDKCLLIDDGLERIHDSDKKCN